MNKVAKRIEAIKKKESKEGLNYWERGFVANIGRVSTSDKFKGLSEKQEACLKKIEVKLGIDDPEEPEYPTEYGPIDERLRKVDSAAKYKPLDDDIPF